VKLLSRLGRAAALLACGALPVLACDVRGGERPEGVRFVTGTVTIPDKDILGRQVTGLQIAAVALGTPEDPDRFDIYPSAVFDASRIENARFRALVDEERTFFVVLQVPSASAGGPGKLLAVMRFEDGRGLGTLLPPGSQDIELSTLSVRVGATAAESTLVVGDGSNPLAQIDTDGDGVADLSDDDDDGDGIPDAVDTDVGGDGVEDAKQVLAALPDGDGDGIPDLFGG
jgi:hypothetical protein